MPIELNSQTSPLSVNRIHAPVNYFYSKQKANSLLRFRCCCYCYCCCCFDCYFCYSLMLYFANTFHFLFAMFSRARIEREWVNRKKKSRESEIDRNTQSFNWIFVKYFRIWFERKVTVIFFQHEVLKREMMISSTITTFSYVKWILSFFLINKQIARKFTQQYLEQPNHAFLCLVCVYIRPEHPFRSNSFERPFFSTSVKRNLTQRNQIISQWIV